ncbi:murein L,D-transpeptidase catalytic domain-containing protein [Ferruginibacter sp.]
MKFIFKTVATVLLVLASLSALAYFLCLPRLFRGYKPKFNPTTSAVSFKVKKDEIEKNALLRLKQKADDMALYAKQNHFNNRYCFMVDMKIESGKKRFFVYNLKKDSVELSGLVTHGGGKTTADAIQFSNTPNSLCTSVGKYKIGNAYTGKFGLAFKLHGLDNTNSNAYNRFVVLHSHACVPNEEVAPLNICESWGCPTVAPAFLTELKKYIDQSAQPILLNIYY